MGRRHQLFCILTIALAAGKLGAGGSGCNLAVVVNQNSANSIQLANAYCEQREVPPQNVLRLNYQWPGGSISCTADEWQNQLILPLLNMLQSRNLTHQIQFVLLSMDLPYRVLGTNGVNSSTSVIFYGFKPDVPPPPGLPISCSLPEDSSNSYALSELPFSDALPNTAPTNSFLAVMLTDSNLAGAENILAHGVASDSSFPLQPVLLAKTSDPARNIRYVEFDNAIFDARLRNDDSVTRTNTDSTSFTNLLGLETGLANYSIPSNSFIPGAMADSFTSFGGDLFENSGQTPLLAFLEGGASGSYGTVVEPCNYLQKFPNPLDYFYQIRGFSLAESYYQSVHNPYQGLIVCEPLSAPFALRGSGNWINPPSDAAVLSGPTNLQLQFSSAGPNLPLNQVDLFVDDVWLETLANIPPTPGDQVSVTLNGWVNNYSIPTNATLQSVASALAELLNSASNRTLVSATAFGDRIELRSLDPARPGAAVTLEASATNTTFLLPANPAFLDTIATGYHSLQVNNTPAAGDWLQLAVTKTNGTRITLGVTNTSSNGTIGQLLQTLLNDVNTTATLQAPDGIHADDFDDGGTVAAFNLYAQTPGWAAAGIQVTLTASPDLSIQPSGSSLLDDNLSDLQPRDHLYVASGRLSLPVLWTLDTTQLPDGYHQLTAVAYEGTSVRTQTHLTRNIRIQNTGLSATLNTLFGGSNTDLNATLQFSVTATPNNVNTIELFSTGGSLGIASNQSTVYFSVAATNLGLGLHPFYAIVTDNSGHRYRTATTQIRLIGPEPPFSITASYPPLTLTWPATAGRKYNILMTTNLRTPFQMIGATIPSNSVALWTDTNSLAAERFYHIEAAY